MGYNCVKNCKAKIDFKEIVGLAEDNVNALKQLRARIESEFKKNT